MEYTDVLYEKVGKKDVYTINGQEELFHMRKFKQYTEQWVLALLIYKQNFFKRRKGNGGNDCYVVLL